MPHRVSPATINPISTPEDTHDWCTEFSLAYTPLAAHTNLAGPSSVEINTFLDILATAETAQELLKRFETWSLDHAPGAFQQNTDDDRQVGIVRNPFVAAGLMTMCLTAADGVLREIKEGRMQIDGGDGVVGYDHIDDETRARVSEILRVNQDFRWSEVREGSVPLRFMMGLSAKES